MMIGIVGVVSVTHHYS